MKTTDLQFHFVFEQSPAKVFEAINNVRGWWSEGLSGETKNTGDEFVYRHRDLHESKQRIVEMVPEKKITWLVTESALSFLKHPGEWTNTRVQFEISKKNGQTELQFTHVGLTASSECFEACSKGWGYYLQSLGALITTGKGHPDPHQLSTATI